MNTNMNTRSVENGTKCDERLREIAETVFEDPEEMGRALNDLAAAVLGLRFQAASDAGGPAKWVPTVNGRPIQTRMGGKPIPEECRTETCERCGAGVVIFRSRKPPYRDYKCDSEMGEHEGRRQMLTAANWLHQCAPLRVGRPSASRNSGAGGRR
jgi:hypothetical protein